MTALAVIARILPGKVWAALGAVVVAALMLWLHQRHAAQVVESAVLADRALWRAEAQRQLQDAQLDALHRETAAAVAALEVIHEYQTRLAAVRADVGRAAVERDRLRDLIAALRRGQGAAPDGSGPRSLADAAGSIADGLSECSGQLVEVAAERDGLSVKLSGLQDYITTVVGPVCVAGLADVQASESGSWP